MSLEAKLDKLTEVMEGMPAKIAAAIAAGGGKTAEAPKAEAPKADAKPAGKKAPAAPKVPTVEEVKAALVEYARKKDKAAAKALMAKFGAKDSASVAEDKRAALIAATLAGDEEEAEEEEAAAEDDDL